MRIFLISLLIIVLSWPKDSMAQNSSAVNWSYTDVKLGTILATIEKEHELQFSYVKSRLPLSRKVSIHLQNVPLDEALAILFASTNIAAAQIGGEWVLKPAKSKKRKALPPPPKKVEPKKDTVVEPDTMTSLSQQPPAPKREFRTTTIPALQVNQIPIEENLYDQNYTEKTIMKRLQADVEDVFASWKARKSSGDLQVFQLSTFGTGKQRSQKTNILGLSFGWGVHGSVEGVQLSVLGTHVRKNAFGLQAAGIFNSVGEKAYGLQIAGLINSTQGDVMGMQVAGLLNRSDHLIGGQISLGFNWADGPLKGTQIAGIANLAKGSAHSAQVAGLFNQTKGATNLQLSGTYNHAATVEGAQISAGLNTTKRLKGVQIGVVNKAEKVQGLQLGIINVVDSLKGVSIGLINIVKNGGFNKLEIASDEAMHVFLSAKFGSKQLYSIYQGGFSLLDKSWALGGGIGSSLLINRRWDMSIELIAMHINEDVNWLPQLNLLTNARYFLEYKMDTGFSFFMGPTFNFMFSKYVHPETSKVGSDLPLYSLYNSTSTRQVNSRFWIGGMAGLRLNLW